MDLEYRFGEVIPRPLLSHILYTMILIVRYRFVLERSSLLSVAVVFLTTYTAYGKPESQHIRNVLENTNIYRLSCERVFRFYLSEWRNKAKVSSDVSSRLSCGTLGCRLTAVRSTLSLTR